MICPSDSHDTLHGAAAGYLAAGLCVLPAIRAEKRPAVGQWKRYRKRLPTEAELAAWFANGPDAVCILCGGISGHAEMIDFDAGGELFDAWARRIPADLLARLAVETTQRGGRHVFYRCEAPVCGNMKLAQRREGDKTVTLIETRGEGGLFLCAPTAGYEAIQGDLRAPPVLTEADRDALLAAAWELNEYLPPPVGETGPVANGTPRNRPWRHPASVRARTIRTPAHCRPTVRTIAILGPTIRRTARSRRHRSHMAHSRQRFRTGQAMISMIAEMCAMCSHSTDGRSSGAERTSTGVVRARLLAGRPR